MEPITTAIVTAAATGLAKDVVKTAYDKLTGLIFRSTPEDKKSGIELAIAGLEKAKAELEEKIAAAGLAGNDEILKQANELLKAAGNHIAVTGNQNATAAGGSKAVVITGNAGDVNL